MSAHYARVAAAAHVAAEAPAVQGVDRERVAVVLGVLVFGLALAFTVAGAVA